MKKLFILLMMLFSINMAYSQEYTREGKTFTATTKQKAKSEPKATGFTWKEKDGEHPIFMSKSGSCFILKTSSKTSKEYRKYLGPEISQEICKELGIEYKGKKTKG